MHACRESRLAFVLSHSVFLFRNLKSIRVFFKGVDFSSFFNFLWLLVSHLQLALKGITSLNSCRAFFEKLLFVLFFLNNFLVYNLHSQASAVTGTGSCCLLVNRQSVWMLHCGQSDHNWTAFLSRAKEVKPLKAFLHCWLALGAVYNPPLGGSMHQVWLQAPIGGLALLPAGLNVISATHFQLVSLK